MKHATLFRSLALAATCTTWITAAALAEQNCDKACEEKKPQAGAAIAKAADLSPEEKAQFEAARKKVLESNPDLATKEKELKDKMKAMNKETPKEDKKALREEGKAQRDAMKAEMLKVDPALAPVFDKVDAAKGKMRDKIKEKHENKE